MVDFICRCGGSPDAPRTQVPRVTRQANGFREVTGQRVRITLIPEDDNDGALVATVARTCGSRLHLTGVVRFFCGRPRPESDQVLDTRSPNFLELAFIGS